MGNSVMANLPPINGLYVAFFAVLMYVLFGTSRHMSLGTHGTISIMVGSIVKRYEGTLYPYEEFDAKTGVHSIYDVHRDLINDEYIENLNSQSPLRDNGTDLYLSLDPYEGKIMIAMCLTFLVGLIQVNNLKHFF